MFLTEPVDSNWRDIAEQLLQAFQHVLCEHITCTPCRSPNLFLLRHAPLQHPVQLHKALSLKLALTLTLLKWMLYWFKLNFPDKLLWSFYVLYRCDVDPTDR